MGLASVPFYSSLVGKEINGLKLTTGHVLLIGAVITHGSGKLNCCVASAETLADEVGQTPATVKNYRSALITAGVFEVLEADRSGYIKSMAVSECIIDLLHDKGDLKAFKKSLKGNQKIFEGSTEVPTGVGETYNRNYSSIITPQTPQRGASQGVRMKPSALRQELARIFKSSDPSKKQSTQSVAQLQERIDDDQLILKAARKMKAQPPIEIKGRMWKPDYFWFVNPDKTETVAKRIIEAVKEDLIEEEIPEGLREQYDVAITLGEAQDYNECRENWGKILPKIKFTDEYRRLTDGR